MTHYDVLIIGGGQAGVPLAHALAGEGRTVALAERKHLGGSCVNFGCTPTKAAVASARVAHLARRAADYGVHTGDVTVDFPAVLARARRIRDDSRESLQQGFEDADNPMLLRGHARFTGRTEKGFALDIGGQTVTAGRVVLNTGGRTRMPEVDGLDAVDAIHAGTWLDHETLPTHLVIIGGGYIGLEMAQFYRRMGSRVTVLQHGDQVLPREDEDVAEAIQQLLEDEGIDIRLQTSAARVEKTADGLRVVTEAEGSDTLAASHLFVATGRLPNTDDLGLEAVGVARTDEGYVEVDDRLATSVDGIWAAGDVRGGPMFTHTAYDDFRVLRSQFLGDGEETTDRVVPYAVFIDPELGRVGLTESEAREQGYDVQIARMDMDSSGKAHEIGETAGFIKVVLDAATDRVLGAAVLAVEGAELVHTYITLMNADAPYTVTRDAVHIHPTLSEAVQSVLVDVE